MLTIPQDIVTPAQRRALRLLAETLQQNHIPFQLTGGLAAIIYGARRPLNDIDIDVPASAIPAIELLFHAHISLPFTHLQDSEFDLYLLTLHLNGVQVDVSQAENAFVLDPTGQRILLETDIASAQFHPFDGLLLPVQRRDHLIRYKQTLSRATDLLDIAQLTRPTH